MLHRSVNTAGHHGPSHLQRHDGFLFCVNLALQYELAAQEVVRKTTSARSYVILTPLTKHVAGTCPGCSALGYPEDAALPYPEPLHAKINAFYSSQALH